MNHCVSDPFERHGVGSCEMREMWLDGWMVGWVRGWMDGGRLVGLGVNWAVWRAWMTSVAHTATILLEAAEANQ